MKLNLLPLALTILSATMLHAVGIESKGEKLTLSQETMVPGTTLQPGTYTILVVDHLQDRYILRIESSSGADHTLFIGVPAAGLKSNGAGAVTYPSAPGGKAALRGYVFKGTGGIEFVYPKDDAVALAKSNGSKVLAVDPKSEGKPEQLANLNKDEMQMVTLWMLTPTPVGSGGDPQIAAAKYQQQAASASPHRPALASLPHTASVLPIMLLVGVLSLLGAGAMAYRRIAGAALL